MKTSFQARVSVPARARYRIILAASLMLMGCTTQTSTPSRAGSGSQGVMDSMAPILSVERFLQAANSYDFDAMARLFGTVDGPMPGEPLEIEQQMDLIARILRHDDFEVSSERPLAGRQARTTRVGVDLTIGGRVFPDVGFEVVRTNDGQWMVEVIDLVAITNR